MNNQPEPKPKDNLKKPPLINPERGMVDLKGDDNNPTGQPLQLPSSPAKAKKNNLPLILSGVVGIILIIAPIAFLLKQKLTSKPQVYLQGQPISGDTYKVGDPCNKPNDNPYLGPGTCQADTTNNWAVREHFKCVDGKVENYFEKDTGCCQELGDDAKNLLNCTEGEATPTPTTGSGGEADVCCDGTPTCIEKKGEGWRCVRKEGTNCEGGSTCQYKPGDPAYCADDNDCAAWEVCQENTCRSRAGCYRDSDCADGAKCVNNSCVGVKDTIECFADINGVKVTNKTDRTLTNGQVTWFARWCYNPSSPGFCSGGSNDETGITLKPGDSLSLSMTNRKDPSKQQCDWQTDISAVFSGGLSCEASSHGRDPNCQTTTPTPSPTPTIPETGKTACYLVKIDKINGQTYNQQTIKPNDKLTFIGKGYTTTNKNIDKIIFTVFKNGQKVREVEGSQPQFTISNGKKVYTSSYVYTVPEEGFGDYSVSVSVHEPTEGWFCTSGGVDG